MSALSSTQLLPPNGKIITRDPSFTREAPSTQWDLSFGQTKDNGITALGQVHLAAFKTDKSLIFMLNGKSESTHESLMERSIKAWLDYHNN